MNRLFQTMSRAFAVVSILLLLLSTAVTAEDGVEFRRLSVAEYRARLGRQELWRRHGAWAADIVSRQVERVGHTS